MGTFSRVHCLWRINPFEFSFLTSHMNEFVFCDSYDWGVWCHLGEGNLYKGQRTQIFESKPLATESCAKY